MESNPIFIVGMPASGKSTFGRALARRLGRRFVDLDAYIENRFHTTVRALFADRGERAFRRLEALMLREVGEFEDVVVANMEYMRSRGLTVWLEAGEERLMQRIRQRPDKRPLLAGLEGEALRRRLRQMAEARNPFYAMAAVKTDSKRLETRSQIDAAIEGFLGRMREPFS